MKKRLLFPILFLFCLASQASAQGVSLQLSAAGVKAGFNRASVSVEEEDDLKSRLGLVGGGFVRFDIAESFGFQPEFLITQKGTTYEDFVSFFDDDPTTFTYALTYLEFPLLARYEFASEGSWKPFVFAGPAIGFRIAGSEKAEGSDEDFFDPDDVKGTELSFVLGGGAQLDKVGLEARFTSGGDILKGTERGIPIVGKNRVFSVLVSYRLR